MESSFIKNQDSVLFYFLKNYLKEIFDENLDDILLFKSDSFSIESMKNSSTILVEISKKNTQDSSYNLYNLLNEPINLKAEVYCLLSIFIKNNINLAKLEIHLNLYLREENEHSIIIRLIYFVLFPELRYLDSKNKIKSYLNLRFPKEIIKSKISSMA